MIESIECRKAFSLLSIPAFAYLIFKAVKINQKINGKWLSFIAALIRVKREKRTNRNRIEFYDFKQENDAYKCGSLPSDHEWNLETPDFQNDENIFVFGVNSNAQLLKLNISKSKEENGKAAFKASLYLKIDQNKIYTLNEEYLLPAPDVNSKEYKIGALSWEVLNPFRRLRLKFRGYLKREEDNELVYVRFRLHWFSNTNVYDHKCSFEPLFAAQQFAKNGCATIEFEDRLEQFGQIKGTLNIENEQEKQIFLWGARSKTLNFTNIKASRFYGIAKSGNGFSVGYVHNKAKNIRYIYGLFKDISGVLKKVKRITLQNSDLESISANNFNFLIETKENIIEVIVKNDLSNGDLLRNAKVDESEAKCIAIYEEFGEDHFSEIRRKKYPLAYSVANMTDISSDLILPLSDEKGQSVIVSGGKGSSLVYLATLSRILNEKFKVPKGFILTSNAYNLLLQENEDLRKEIDTLQSIAWSQKYDLKSECERVVELISNHKMPEKVKSALEQQLDSIYGNLVSYTYFAVRSSAVGEDSEEMSAAGQLTTFLGVKGKDDISKAVMKCWASQFGYNYTEYKRGYGQLISNTMAVVILEMVDCDTAGVIFTCNPLNGDERQIVITANYGLGESVVSASSEPDTIRVKINVKSNNLNEKRTVDSIESIEVGRKAKFIKLREGGGTIEMDVKKVDTCCVDTVNLMKLAQMSLDIHAFYGSVRDIEWGLKNGEIWILQSRPLTNLDSSYTEWEMIHYTDHGFQRENEFFTRIHWNENFPGATSPLSLSTFTKMLDENFQRVLNEMLRRDPTNPENFCPYISKSLVPFYSQVFMNLGEVADTHSRISMSAGVFTGAILNTLYDGKVEYEDVFHDFGKILSSCTGILSAEVPKMLRDIAQSIENYDEFSKMNDEDALKFLLSEENEASKKFICFLKRHGYRGLRELDFAALQWGDEPIKLVSLLKTFRLNKSSEEASKIMPISEVLFSLKTNPSFLKKLILRHFLIPLAFRNIRSREESKSMIAFYVSKYRDAFWNLARKLSYEEGKLPDPELMFYLTYAEVDSLIKERNPLLVAKAKRRRNMQSKLDRLLFKDIVKEWEVEPLNREKSIDVSKLTGALTIKGTSVTPLTVKGRLFVAHSLEDAKDLQKGDILLTHTTDIGWSPYFPKVSGIVTEMGGLNSHGAVIAREFGLPCLIAIVNGCHLFKTGDIVLINGENGTITRLEE
ncbi:Cleft lip and palate transmembrane protein 1-like protein [Dinothrombium tinctorium]|uniref:Cleft lip and palate transmembrane protein 1-like protein n=1 Tax=Dinothrombium tinctorium TaxID=1965070 RepID=A0A3S3SMJ6_9ACAR|nr:Cleft lip and palate transmembrane protein 1-like protein [Dinothrombium tinctorium]